MLCDNNQKYHLSYGDLFCTQDQAYQQFRKQVRNPLWQKDFLSKTIAERIEAGKQARLESQKINTEQIQINEKILDVDNETIKKTLVQYQCDILHGHTHRKNIHCSTIKINGKKQEFKRIVLSDWSENYANAYLIFADKNQNRFIDINLKN